MKLRLLEKIVSTVQMIFQPVVLVVMASKNLMKIVKYVLKIMVPVEEQVQEVYCVAIE